MFLKMENDDYMGSFLKREVDIISYYPTGATVPYGTCRAGVKTFGMMEFVPRFYGGRSPGPPPCMWLRFGPTWNNPFSGPQRLSQEHQGTPLKVFKSIRKIYGFVSCPSIYSYPGQSYVNSILPCHGHGLPPP